MSLLPTERRVLVQSALYPHAGYASRVRLLTPESVADPANVDAAILIAPKLSGYPFSEVEIREFAQLPVIEQWTTGLLAVRNRGLKL